MKYKTAFRLALKAIGVLVIAQHLPMAIISTCSVSVTILTEGMLGFGPMSTLSWELQTGIMYVMGALVGCYLLFGGRWIVDRAIPSNRPYCHECAYELTGNVTGVCPECGTVNKAPERVANSNGA